MIKTVYVCLLATFLPSLVFWVVSKITNKKENFEKGDLILKLPNIVLIIGYIGIITSSSVMLFFTITNKETPHPIFYIFFSLFFWISMYLVLKTLNFKVVVNNKNITVFSTFKKPYTFNYDEIIYVKRKVSKDRFKTETIIIRTKSRKRIAVESIEISYFKFKDKLISNIEKEKLLGFD